MSRIIVRNDSCTGCRSCQVICSMHHQRNIAPSAARIRIKSKYPWIDQPVVCQQCKAPKCKEACAVEAITAAGAVPVVDQAKCTGCWECVKACPFGAIWEDVKAGIPLVCDTCSGEYQCVKWCQPKALTLGGD
ncbi:4Fe-4S dicluster domain-containing protein [Sporomusa sp.]|uniref:4Fe-4S dicluster domain-containing protein n=1 Tax=Sporomusa sp. TaxID=2078658 RepID=UPI002BC49EB8|nr:4Fe-4S dicluster domain-containing protein [Sporomusa sp.]HWR45689.1 4Fe-4S dicluster domain-containing protein [Sporomusa sp.]